MGGRHWSPAEEACFWNEVVPRSYKRLDEDRDKYPVQDWFQLAKRMQRTMGQDALREYTEAALCMFPPGLLPSCHRNLRGSNMSLSEQTSISTRMSSNKNSPSMPRNMLRGILRRRRKRARRGAQDVCG